MNFVNKQEIERFWKIEFGLSPSEVLTKSNQVWRHEILNFTFKKFTDSWIHVDGKFRTSYSNYISRRKGWIDKSVVHTGITDYKSITSVKQLVTLLKQVQHIEKKLKEREISIQDIKEERYIKLKKIRNQNAEKSKNIKR